MFNVHVCSSKRKCATIICSKHLQNSFEYVRVEKAASNKPEFFVDGSDYDLLSGKTTVKAGESSDQACDRSLELAFVGPVSTSRSSQSFNIATLPSGLKLWVNGSNKLVSDCPIIAWAIPIISDGEKKKKDDAPTLDVVLVTKNVALPAHLGCGAEITLTIPVLRLPETKATKVGKASAASAAEGCEKVKLTRPELRGEFLDKQVKPMDLAAPSVGLCVLRAFVISVTHRAQTLFKFVKAVFPHAAVDSAKLHSHCSCW